VSTWHDWRMRRVFRWKIVTGGAGKLVKWLTFVDNYFPHINGKTCIKFVIYADNTYIDLVFTNKDVRRFSRHAGNFWSLNRKESTTGSHKVAEVVLSRTYKRILSFLLFSPGKSTNICGKMSQPISRLLAGHKFSCCRNRGIVGSWAFCVCNIFMKASYVQQCS
jgi:hypothetical protein